MLHKGTRKSMNSTCFVCERVGLRKSCAMKGCDKSFLLSAQWRSQR